MSTASFAAADPDFRDRIGTMLRAMPIFAHFGLEVTRLEPGLCDLDFPYRADFAAANGIFMAGAIGTAGDIAAGIAGATLLAPRWTMSTIDFTVKLLAPAKGERLVAEGRTVRAGRTITVNTADIFALDGGRRTLCATLLMTTSNREMKG